VPVSEGVLRVLQLNVDSLVGGRWPERRDEIVRWLDDLEPDVACFQEIWQDDRHPNTGGWIADHAASDWYWEFGGFAPPDPDAVGAHASMRFGSAILSRWPLDVAEVMSLPVCDDGAHPSYLRSRPPALPPAMPLELVHVRTAGIDLYSTHLQPLPAQAPCRVQQVLFIDDAIGHTYDPSSSMPPILCGDFNAPPTSDEIRFLTANAVIEGRSTYFQDAWAALHDQGGVTFDPADDLVDESNELPQRVDYVFVGESYRPDRAGRILHASLAFDSPKTGVLASDHYGLSVEIAWPTRPSAPN
jgi:endonuclease/exonuclease/phosphatase family metal-dependent hydrolase